MWARLKLSTRITAWRPLGSNREDTAASCDSTPGLQTVNVAKEMKPIRQRRASSVLLAILVLLALLDQRGASAEVWFTGKEIFPIEGAANYLQVADFDGDGRVDIALANQLGDEITLLYNRGDAAPDKEEVAAVSTPRNPNDLRPDGRFEFDSLPTDLVEIDALIHGDFNGDGLLDLAYSGEPQRLIVQPGAVGRAWGEPFSLPLDGGLKVNGADAMARGDLNGDGRDDIIALSARDYLVYLQTESKTLAPPEVYPISGAVQGLMVADLNNDQRDDLLLIGSGAKQARARFQDPSGRLGPEVFFEFLDSGSHWVGDLDGDQRNEVVTATPTTERARLSRLSKLLPDDGSGYETKRQLNFLPIGRSSSSQRGLTWRDIDLDGARDLLVADPASGSLVFSRQDPEFGFSDAVSFPSFADIAQIEALDWDRDGSIEIFVLQKPENQLGVTRLNAEGRIEFPEDTPAAGLPVAIERFDDANGGQAELAVLSRDDEEANTVQLQMLGSDGVRDSWEFETDAFRDPSIETAFYAFDIDQDGNRDLVAIPDTFEPLILVFRQKSRKSFELIELDFPGATDNRWLSAGDIDGDGKPEALTGKDQFLRAFRLRRQRFAGGSPWRLQVVDQVNAPASADVAGAVFVGATSEAAASLYLYDRESKRVLRCREDERGVWRPENALALPDIAFSSFGSQVLGANQTLCLTFESDDAVGWMPLEGPAWTMEELATYETPIEDNPSLNGVIAGDLTQDGTLELLFIEGANGHLEVVDWEAGKPMVSLTRWKVFDALFLQQQFTNFAEPREAAIADFTGDGAPDVLTLVHDRLILYPLEKAAPSDTNVGPQTAASAD